MMRRPWISVVAAVAILATVQGCDGKKAVTRTAIPNSTFPISQAVRVPAGMDTVYLSGMVAPITNPNAPKDSIEAYGDTETQATGVFERIKSALQAQGLGLGDIVQMHVYLVGDPSKDGKLDFAGLQAAYTKYFGTPDQPNKPVRAAFQVAALAGPGVLVEIEVVAAKAP